MEGFTLEQLLVVNLWTRMDVNESSLKEMLDYYGQLVGLISAVESINTSLDAGVKPLPSLELKPEKSFSLALYTQNINVLKDKLIAEGNARHLIDLELKEKVKEDLVSLLKVKIQGDNTMRQIMKKEYRPLTTAK